MDLVHLPLLWLVTSWLSLQHFQFFHLIVDSVARTLGGQNAKRRQILSIVCKQTVGRCQNTEYQVCHGVRTDY